MTFLLGVFVLAVLSGGTAAVAGFGIGSLLTPLLAASFGTATAVAAVAIPHAAATALRCWRLRANIDWTVVRSFGLLSAAGGLIGALLYTRFSNDALTLTLGLLLVSTAMATIVDLPSRLRVTGATIGAFGLLSGLFGGLAFARRPAVLAEVGGDVNVSIDEARQHGEPRQVIRDACTGGRSNALDSRAFDDDVHRS